MSMEELEQGSKKLSWKNKNHKKRISSDISLQVCHLK